jgi:tetratricopeptide (TPR) repeat protein
MTTLDPLDIPDLLAGLVERSLVVCDPVTGRHHMTESMRVYAGEHLTTEDQLARKRHFEYFKSYGERMLELNHSYQNAKAYALFVQEIDNLRLAMEWALINDPKGCLHLISCTGRSWARLHRIEAQDLFASAMDSTPDIADVDHVSARTQLAHIKLRQDLHEEAGDLLEVARRQIEEVVEPSWGLRFSLMLGSGIQQSYVGKREVAREYYLRALELANKHGGRPHQGAANINIGELSRMEGDLEAAAKYYEEALRLSHGDFFADSVVCFNLGSVLIQMNDLLRAEHSFRQSIDVLRRATGIETVAAALGGLGYVFVKLERYREAGLLMGYSEAPQKRA